MLRSLLRSAFLSLVALSPVLALAQAGEPPECPPESVLPLPSDPSFVAFESGPVRPLTLAQTSAGTMLLATNTPDNRLEIFTVNPDGTLAHAHSVPVGLEPVAVSVSSDDEAWVVNHLSDSVSIVDLVPTAPAPPHVTNTLLVGDEPRDIVFATGKLRDGQTKELAFITTARRGQHFELVVNQREVYNEEDERIDVGAGWNTPGLGRALIWVFDATTRRDELGGHPDRIVELAGDTPRALAVSNDRVYAAVFHSGNRTTIIPHGASPANPTADPKSVEVGTIVKRCETGAEDWCDIGSTGATEGWFDENQRNFTNEVQLELPDEDVFAINPMTFGVKPIPHVGTTIFNMVVNAGTTSDTIFVSNTESMNHIRFEGCGAWVQEPEHSPKPNGLPASVQGRLALSHITRIENVKAGAATVEPIHLNSHLDYQIHDTGSDSSRKDKSLAIPLAMALSSDDTVYLAAFGSRRIGVFKAGDLVDGFDPTQPGASSGVEPSASYIDLASDDDPLMAGGPSGLALNEAAPSPRLYVLTRFDNRLWEIPLDSIDPTKEPDEQWTYHDLYDYEPEYVTKGRRFLYDADYTSSNGEASCAACHVFGDMDHLAWDLGNPNGGGEIPNLNPDLFDKAQTEADAGAPDLDEHLDTMVDAGFESFVETDAAFSDLKGPMMTQSLRGMRGQGPLHWRGDRSVANNEECKGDPLKDDIGNFVKFNPAFEHLIGRAPADPSEVAEEKWGCDIYDTAQLPSEEMEDFARFAMSLTYPPNPIRGLTELAVIPERAPPDSDPDDVGTLGVASLYMAHLADGNFLSCNHCHVLDGIGHFGTDGHSTGEGTGSTQSFKVPHLRNLYQKVGMFGMPGGSLVANPLAPPTGPQVRGFGFAHDGSVDTLFNFLRAGVFSLTDVDRTKLEELLVGFPSELAPIVGQQITLDANNTGPAASFPSTDQEERLEKLLEMAAAGKCDVVAKGQSRGWEYIPQQARFAPDRNDEDPISRTELLALLATGRPITFTATPPGSGQRIGVDRDNDGAFDRLEADANTDPTDATDEPGDPPTFRFCLGGTREEVFGLNTAAGFDTGSEDWTTFVTTTLGLINASDPTTTLGQQENPIVPASTEGEPTTEVTVTATNTSTLTAECKVAMRVVRPADFMLVLDDTYSMRQLTADGSQVTKRDAMENAVNLFVGLLAGHRQADRIDDRIAIRTFKRPPASPPSSGTCEETWSEWALEAAPLSTVTAQGDTSLVAALAQIEATGTATPIRAGFDQGMTALSELPNPNEIPRGKHMLLLSDGMQNTPGCEVDIGASPPDHPDVNVTSIGFGHSSQISEPVLQHVADHYERAEDPVQLQKAFLQSFFAPTTEQEIINDPEGTLDAGQSVEMSVRLTSDAQTVTIVAMWARAETSLKLSLAAPGATGATVVDDAGNGVRHLMGDTWAAWLLRFPLGGDLSDKHAGDWVARLTHESDPASPSEPWAMIAFGDAPIAMEVQPTAPGLVPGDTTSVQVSLASTEVRNASVVLHLDEPTVPFGGALSKFGMSDRDVVRSIRLTKGGDRTAASARLELFYERTGGIPTKRRSVTLVDDGKHGDGRAGDGVFGAPVKLPVRDGSYALTFVSEGRNEKGETFRREHRGGLYLPVRPDPRATVIDRLHVTKKPDWWSAQQRLGKSRSVRSKTRTEVHRLIVTPKDANGLLLGPGFADQIRARVVEWRGWTRRVRTAKAVDLGDGRYSVDIETRANARSLRVELAVSKVKVANTQVVKPPWWLFFLRWI